MSHHEVYEMQNAKKYQDAFLAILTLNPLRCGRYGTHVSVCVTRI